MHACCLSPTRCWPVSGSECRRRSHPLPHGRHPRRRLAGEPRARAHVGKRRLLQRQPPHQSHQRVRGRVPAVRLRPQEGHARCLHHGASKKRFRSAASGYTEAVTEFHIVGGLHPDLPFQYFLDLVSRLQAALPAGAPEGVHHGGDRVPGEARQAVHSRRRWCN